MARRFTEMPPTVLDKLKSLCPDPTDSGACNKYLVAIDTLILARLRRLGADREDAADMKQDTWLRYWEVKTVPENPIGYMLQIADSVFKGDYRDGKNRMRIRDTRPYPTDEIEKLPNNYNPTLDIVANSEATLIEDVKKLRTEGFLPDEISRDKKLPLKQVNDMLEKALKDINSKPTLKTSKS